MLLNLLSIYVYYFFCYVCLSNLCCVNQNTLSFITILTFARIAYFLFNATEVTKTHIIVTFSLIEETFIESETHVVTSRIVTICLHSITFVEVFKLRSTLFLFHTLFLSSLSNKLRNLNRCHIQEFH